MGSTTGREQVNLDEKKLWDALDNFATPRDAIAALEIPPKRGWYLLEKWAKNGLYQYGASIDLGWKVKGENK